MHQYYRSGAESETRIVSKQKSASDEGNRCGEQSWRPDARSAVVLIQATPERCESGAYRVVWRVFAMIFCGNLHQGVNESYHRAINLGLTSYTGEMNITSSLRKPTCTITRTYINVSDQIYRLCLEKIRNTLRCFICKFIVHVSSSFAEAETAICHSF